jgi:hypothetical protein
MQPLLPENLSDELRLVVDSINEVDERYFVEEITRLQDGQIIKTGNFRTNERTFVTQLLHKIQEKFTEKRIHTDKYYQTDQPKHLILNGSSAYHNSFSRLFNPSSRDFFKIPDIVIHSGPNNRMPENQVFVSEVKTSLTLTQKKFNIDLFKVNVYHDALDFQNSAFIIVNSKVSSIEEKLKSYIKDSFYQSKKSGLVIIIKPFNEDVKVFSQF